MLVYVLVRAVVTLVSAQLAMAERTANNKIYATSRIRVFAVHAKMTRLIHLDSDATVHQVTLARDVNEVTNV